MENGNTMKKNLILIAGNLGAGKTTLAKQIGQKLNWYIGYESVSDNPYLPDFYSDMKTWSFHLQVYFLGQRLKQHIYAYNLPQSAVLDRSIYEDAQIFANALHKAGNISDRDYNAYLAIYNYVVETLPAPNMLIYLKAPIQILSQRIKKRGQGFDQDLSIEYLEMISSFYEEWIAGFDLCPVLTIDTGDMNYADKEEDALNIVEYIQQKINSSNK